MLSMIFVGYSYSQDNSNNSSGSPFSSPDSKSKNSLLNLKKKRESFPKKTREQKQKKLFSRC